jgi:predicted dehydrogenase
MNATFNRRRFLAASGLVAANVLVLPAKRLALAAAANDKLRVAGIGVAGQGRGNLDNVAGLGAEIVALGDVDHKYAADTFRKYPQARVFKDFRRMFDEMAGGIDAVIVSTPDHTHAVAAIAAMERGKHVFCEKPLTRTVREARAMREAAQKYKVVTQMGNQGSAAGPLRRAVELAWGGVLGEIREAHVWFDGGNGPLERPKDTPPVPDTLDWDLWLGPAEFRPYHPAYLPGAWRGWRAFGSGIVGDFGCHTANIAFRALRLDWLWQAGGGATPGSHLIKVQAWPSEVNSEGYPRSSRTLVELPARGDLPSAKLTFYAKEKPPGELMLGWPMGGWGDLLVGSKGSLYSECPWNTRYVLLPEAKFEGFKGGPPETLPRTDNHHREWVEACKGRGQTFSPFSIGGPLTELLQLANLATLVEGPVEYHTLTGQIRNNPQADALLHREYRAGWKI